MTLLDRGPRRTLLAEPVPTGDALVSASSVVARRGHRTVLADVDVVVRAGELVVLVGPNGAGKSTLLDVLTGAVDPAAGSVELCGVPLRSWNGLDAARRRAVLPQRPAVGFPFTVEQVVRMGRAPWHRTPLAAHDDEAVRDAMDAVEVDHLRGRSILSLSGGESARVALARVLAQRTQLLLLDEPTGALDIHHEELVLDVVRHRVRAGGGAVVVLHDLGLAAAHADRIVVIAAGRAVADGPPSEVLRTDLLSDVYRHPIDVIPDPRTGSPLVLVRR